MLLDPTAPIRALRDVLRPIGWRGTSPHPAELRGCLLFKRDRRVRSFDGTEIAYTIGGHTGPWVVLVPGFSCPDNFWRYLVPALTDRYRVIVYDLRGQGLSGLPRSPGYRAMRLSPEDFSIPNQAKDLLAVLDKEGIEQAALIGHSMGVQIILEAYREFPERVGALVSLTGPFESPLKTFYGRDFNNIFRGLRFTLEAMPRPAILLWRALFLANPAFTHRLAQFGRSLGPDAKLEDMAPYYRHMAFLDPVVMLKMVESMRAHSAADLLPKVDAPTLVIAADLDTFTPVALAKAMYETMPDAELTVIEGAAHGAVIEKPDEVNEAIRSFLDRRYRTGPGAGVE
jgi:pimeloyl-ACP methyl ester carboxylesterase